MPPFNKILVANRGEIACRIIRTCRKLGIKSVAIFSDSDANAPHVREADESACVGRPPAADSYLNIDRILEVATTTGCQAIHPGYGFLSENVQFAQRCLDAGIIFIGPSISNMEEFSLKHVARKIAAECGVPIVPGSPLLSNRDEAMMHAESVGFPVLIKCTGGGGGIGMQKCFEISELHNAFEAAVTSGSTHFKEVGVFLERFIAQPRHIEVQVFGDGKGTVIALGERECSVQRRFQKMVEESPSPFFVGPDGEAKRCALHDCAVRLCQASSYQSAGTVEFIVDDATGEFFFLEVNTRLQVEHPVTEYVKSIDIVEWMIRLAYGECPDLSINYPTTGHSIEVRLYAEDPGNDYVPCSGVLTNVDFPSHPHARFDTWVASGTTVSSFYDPLLAKIIVHGSSRDEACSHMQAVLSKTSVNGIPTNLRYLQQILGNEEFVAGHTTTLFVINHPYRPRTIDVKSGGMMTTIQDYPGRTGYWDVGVSPSGPMDDLSFRIANALVGNDERAAGLEITMVGPTLKFNCASVIALTGAPLTFHINGLAHPMYTAVAVAEGAVVKIGKIIGPGGCRAYLSVLGGIDVPDYLNSKSTFTLAEMGGLHGRVLGAGDVVPIFETTAKAPRVASITQPTLSAEWDIGVLYGPHGAPDFFTQQSIDDFFRQPYTVHANSNRLGVRLEGPIPKWARLDGGEAGLHPSNIHDCVYAIGSINFTGDFPVILTCDGPSLGGFVCPATVIRSEMWKVGQVKAGDKIRFHRVTYEAALGSRQQQDEFLLSVSAGKAQSSTTVPQLSFAAGGSKSAYDIILYQTASVDADDSVTIRMAGDSNVLIEYGPMMLDLNLRCRVEHVLRWLRANSIPGLQELSPGVRSLQVQFDGRVLPLHILLSHLAIVHAQSVTNIRIPSRIIRLPLAFDDHSCRDAIQRYMKTYPLDKPYLPSNVDFIAQMNGCTTAGVMDTITEATYLVLGLGDVYLGAPCAIPLDPCHRLRTSKYSPARTFTPEGAVGIGGCYMCIYGMNSPGGYQLVGRTLPIWCPYLTNKTFVEGKPWLFRNFDQIQFYIVSDAVLDQMRSDFFSGRLQLTSISTEFDQGEYNDKVREIMADPRSTLLFEKRQHAFDLERQRWYEQGMISGGSLEEKGDEERTGEEQNHCVEVGQATIEASLSGVIRHIAVSIGDTVVAGHLLCTIEAMKMEVPVESSVDGIVVAMLVSVGSSVRQSSALLIVAEQEGL